MTFSSIYIYIYIYIKKKRRAKFQEVETTERKKRKQALYTEEKNKKKQKCVYKIIFSEDVPMKIDPYLFPLVVVVWNYLTLIVMVAFDGYLSE